MSKNTFIDRRTCLKGVGAALALPLLDAMGWAEASEEKAYKPPVRLGFMYMPHGVIMDQFWPTDAESFLTSPPPALDSLRPVLDQCLLMKGISGVPICPFNGAPHALELSTWLTATLPDPDKRNEISISISADQIAADYCGSFHDAAVVGTGHDAANVEGKPRRAERGLLFALQFPLSDPSSPRRDQSTQRAESLISTRRSKAAVGHRQG